MLAGMLRSYFLFKCLNERLRVYNRDGATEPCSFVTCSACFTVSQKKKKKKIKNVEIILDAGIERYKKYMCAYVSTQNTIPI